MNLQIESKIKNYEVSFEKSFDFLKLLKDINSSVFIIDSNVYNLYKEVFKTISIENLFLFDATEENKTFNYVKTIYDFLISRSVKRNLTIVSIGGGITQDLTGFVASTLYRGVKWIFVPTTFLAMTDSCIGSKTSINYNQYKNLMGTFYPPNKIYININFLDTLAKLDFYNGIGETIKFQLMKENYPKDFSKILETIEKVKNTRSYRLEIIHNNMEVKLAYMEGDEFDLGRRNLLNYGHCFGHALETSSSYYIPHGIAVNIGMIFANILSNKRCLLRKEDLHFVNEKILLPNIPLKLRRKDFDDLMLLKSMKNDKKRTGQYLSIVIPNHEFKMIKIDDVTDKEFMESLKELILFCFKGIGNE